VSLVPFGAAIAGITYMSYVAFCPKAKGFCSKVKKNVLYISLGMICLK
jgi:hypothetical protein